MFKKIHTWIYKKAKFEHGGLLHQDEVVNEALAANRYIFPNVVLFMNPVQYRNRTQKFWLMMYHQVERLDNFVNGVRLGFRKFKKYRHHRKITSRIRELKKEM